MVKSSDPMDVVRQAMKKPRAGAGRARHLLTSNELQKTAALFERWWAGESGVDLAIESGLRTSTLYSRFKKIRALAENGK